MSTVFVPIDTPTVLYGIRSSGEMMYLTLAEILQLLQIAELEEDFPDLPKDWKDQVIPAHRQLSSKEKICE